MTIWTYDPNRSGDLALSLGEGPRINWCAFCHSPLQLIGGNELPSYLFKGMNDHKDSLLVCHTCGWWVASFLDAATHTGEYDAGYAYLHRSCGILKELDLRDASVPTMQLRTYLVAKYSDRFDIHPKKYEDIVAGVFSDHGYEVRVTSYSGDEGIDAFVFDGARDATIGIQVKRYRGKISAEQIRSFVGALVLHDLTKGIYVTTSSYQPGATAAADTASTVAGMAIELYDADRFYDALKISQRASHDLNDESAPYFDCWHKRQYKHQAWGSSW